MSQRGKIVLCMFQRFKKIVLHLSSQPSHWTVFHFDISDIVSCLLSSDNGLWNLTNFILERKLSSLGEHILLRDVSKLPLTPSQNYAKNFHKTYSKPSQPHSRSDKHNIKTVSNNHGSQIYQIHILEKASTAFSHIQDLVFIARNIP